MARQNRNPPWSDLPQELLSAIANFLISNPISIFTFRSICHSWRSSCPPLSNSSIFSPLLPFSILLPLRSYTPFYDDSSSSFISVTVIYALRRPLQLSQGRFSSLSPNAWILFVDEFTPGKLSIRKPFSNDSYCTPINFPNVNLIDSGFRELGRFYNLTYSTDYDYDEIRRCKRSKPRFWDIEVNKVVMFPNEIAAIRLHEDGTLGTYRLGARSNERITKCESKHDGKGFRFDDIVEYKGKVLGIDRRGRVYQINYHSSEMTPFVAPIAGGGGRRKRLVESLGRLYLVVRCYVDAGHNNKLARLKLCGPDGIIKEEIRKIRFKVYELIEEKKKWIEISSLGDRSFSFGRNFSFSASTQELGTSVKNCILFTRHSFLSYSSNDDDFTGFKNSELDIGVCHLHEADHFGDIESYPGYSDSLWPPPSWLWSIDRLKRIEIVETAIDGILDKVPKDDKVILKLKKMAVRFREEEIEFKKELHELDGLFEQARTSSHATTEETLGKPDILKTRQACNERLLRVTLDMMRIRDTYLFFIEEHFTEVELKSRLAPILTLAQ
ncbi:putative F-box protein At5g60060 isoform X2 [Silene latifolia]|uniref:putative F-box protein At5g60060 isoform X2 n=1 Tax=Silene latifolia TaxID=37657 RepID=UPI003D776DBF